MAQSRRSRVIYAAIGGAIGGLAASKLGGVPLRGRRLLARLAVGSGIGLVFAVLVVLLCLIADRRAWRSWLVTACWFVPLFAVSLGIALSAKEVLDWAFGQAVAAWAVGWRGQLLAGIVGGLMGGGYEFVATRGRGSAPEGKSAEPGAAADGGGTTAFPGP